MSGKSERSITTGGGDRGETGLRQGVRVSKTHIRPEALGVIDELNALLGVLRAEFPEPILHDRIFRIQNHLFMAGAEIATPGRDGTAPRIGKEALLFLEQIQAGVEESLNLPRQFVVYGGTRMSALIDLARAVARRAERAVLRVHEKEPLEDSTLPVYMNRLSDILYILARAADRGSGNSLDHPDYSQTSVKGKES